MVGLLIALLGLLVILGNRGIGRSYETIFGRGPFRRGWWIELGSGDYLVVVAGGLIMCAGGLALALL